jgi:hypothetical protein
MPVTNSFVGPEFSVLQAEGRRCDRLVHRVSLWPYRPVRSSGAQRMQCMCASIGQVTLLLMAANGGHRAFAMIAKSPRGAVLKTTELPSGDQPGLGCGF